ncbi:MAG: hypothetical protein NTX50_19740 [Candidatus Sumerlaeota bacterium]|nr:hypothetical protein [Candidatus Sumerlaeota bacterium]
MKSATLMNEDKLVEKAVNLLMQNFGPVETTRFLALRPLKRLDSVALHRVRQAKWDKDEFFSKVFDEKAWTRQSKALKLKRKTAISPASSQRLH